MARRQWRLVTDSGKVIADRVAAAETIWARFAGLMMRGPLPPGAGLVLRPCNQIHMFFMRIPLDVVFVDGDGVVLHVLHGIRPWRVSRVVWGARAAIELSAGALTGIDLKRGDRVRLESTPA